MFNIFRKNAPCEEAPTGPIRVAYPIHQRVLGNFDKLLASEAKMAAACKTMLGTVAALSEFDVRMTHSSYSQKRRKHRSDRRNQAVAPDRRPD